MYRTLGRRFAAWLQGTFARRPVRKSQAERTAMRRSPLVDLGRVVRASRPLIEEQLRSLRAQNQLIDTLEDYLARAWKEREDYVHDYYELLRGILSVLEEDDGPRDPLDGLRMVRDRLGQVLTQQGVSPIAVKTGDRFCSETQRSVEVERSCDVRPGTVLRLLEIGYRRTLPDGESVVVRPAQVVVSGHLSETEESR